jgi:hypothetical protein
MNKKNCKGIERAIDAQQNKYQGEIDLGILIEAEHHRYWQGEQWNEREPRVMK